MILAVPYGVLLLLLMAFSLLNAGENPQRNETQADSHPKKVQPELDLGESGKGMGVIEMERPDGSKDKIYYSITTPEESMKARQEEEEKEEKAWEMLKNIIIDRRSKGRIP